MIFEFWRTLTFGDYLQWLLDLVIDNRALLALILFGYAMIVFLGRYGGIKYIPDKFEEYVITKSSELLAQNNKCKPNELVDLVYKGWGDELSKFPPYIYIKSEKDYWIEKPTMKKVDIRLDINKNKANEILIKHGVIIGKKIK